MANKVDGLGPCANNPDTKNGHEWRYACMYQVNPEPPKLQGAAPGPIHVYQRYYCIYCLDQRDVEVPIPIAAGITIQNVIAMQPAAGARGLVH